MARNIEEAWLLWKLGQHQEAQVKVRMLRKQAPNNPELLQLAVLAALEQKDFRSAKDLISQLELTDANKTTIYGFKISLAFSQSQWQEAARLMEDEIVRDPTHFDIKKDYAYVLFQLKRWKQALTQYEELIKDRNTEKSIIWDYRSVLEQASNEVGITSEIIQAPESLREYINTQSFLVRISPKLSLRGDSFEELYTKRALGDTAAIRQRVYGHRLKMDWAADEHWSLGGDWESDYLNGEDSNELGLKADYHGQSLSSSLGYDYNHLVRGPLNGLMKEGHWDRVYLTNEAMLTQRLLIGDICDLEWYRVGKGQNEVNGKQSLGNKYTYDVYSNYLLFLKPYLRQHYL